MIFVDALVTHRAAKDADARRVGARNGHRWCHLFTDGPEEHEPDLVELLEEGGGR